MSTTSSSTPVERATRRCSKSPVIVRSFGFVSKPEWPQRCEPTSLSVRSGVGRRLRHSGQRDIFLAIAGNEREFTILPVLLGLIDPVARRADEIPPQMTRGRERRSEEHTSELQSLMRISYAVFCLKKKK